jgi:hypothetical protein
MSLSKRPKLIEINGIDEAGRVGERIYLARIGVPIPSELSILLENLKHFGNLLIGHNDLKGRDEGSLVKYVRDILDNSAISHSLYVLREETQLKILRQLMKLQGESYFLHRKTLINIIQGEEYDNAQLSKTISDLSVLQNEPPYVESFVKAFAIREIVANLDTQSPLLRDNRPIDRLIVIQIDGGFPFVFWWRDDIDSGRLAKLTIGKVFFSGITSGDAYYPTISTAGAIASIIQKHPTYSHLFPIRELECNPELLDAGYYQRHLDSFTRPFFQFRMLLIGEIGDSLRRMLPFALHRTDRSKTWEPFQIEKSVPNFLDNYGAGGPDNTIGVYGRLRGNVDKEGVKLLKDEGYNCHHVSELQGSVMKLFDDLSSEISLLPSTTREGLLVKLTKLKETCSAEMK